MGESINIPLFPLGVMLLPGEQTALHIFEPRYRKLLEQVESGKGLFGIPYAVPDENYDLGALVRLIEVSKRYPNGESDILVEGIQVFALDQFTPGSSPDAFPTGEARIIDRYVTWMAGEKVNEELRALREAIGPKADILKDEEYRYMIRIVNSLGLNQEQKYQFLKIANEEKQENHIARLLKLSRLILNQEKRIEGGFFPN